MRHSATLLRCCLTATCWMTLVLALPLVSCDNVSPQSTSQVSRKASVTTSGTVVFRDKDGGFFGILSADGGQLEPTNLDSRYRTDGLHITLTGTLDQSRRGRHNWGTPIDLESVEQVKN